MTPSDLELLQRFARDRAQDAFTELVERHANLVYSAALRQLRSPQLAEEVAQSVFADLAHDAGKLKPGTIVTAWLYQVTRRTAIDVIRKESRRQLREQIAVEMNAMNTTESSAGVSPAWSEIAPLLDEAVSALDETDRAAVLLRYFKNQSLREVGAALGAGEDAAQKRVSRALERLRKFFAKRGVTVGASGLAVVISANAVKAAPVGLVVTISAAALAGTAATTSTIITATTTSTTIKAIAMTSFQKSLLTLTLASAIGVAVYQNRQASGLREQVENLKVQIAKQQDSKADASIHPLVADLQDEVLSLQTQNMTLAGSLARAKTENSQLDAARAEAERRAKLFKELVDSSSGNDATNQYPTARHAAAGMGRLLRQTAMIESMNQGQDGKLSSEEKKAQSAAAMRVFSELMKAATSLEEKDPNVPVDPADGTAVLLYGALDLNEQQFGQAYSLLQQSREVAKQQGLTGENLSPEAKTALQKLNEQASDGLKKILNPDQAALWQKLSSSIELIPGDGKGFGNIQINLP